MMSKPIVQFKFIGGAGFIRIGHRARIMVFDHPKISRGGRWEEVTTTEVIEIDREGGTFETQNTIYKEAFKFYRDQLDLFTPPPEEKPCLKTREEVAAFINDQFRDKYVCSREKGGWHYGKQDLRVLMDFLYDGEPLSDEQKITGE